MRKVSRVAVMLGGDRASQCGGTLEHTSVLSTIDMFQRDCLLCDITIALYNQTSVAGAQESRSRIFFFGVSYINIPYNSILYIRYATVER